MAKVMAETQHAQAKLDTESALRLADMNAKYGTALTVAQIKSAAEQFRAQADVAMQAADHAHDHALAEQQHAHGLAETVADRVLGTALAPPQPETEAPPEHEADEDE